MKWLGGKKVYLFLALFFLCSSQALSQTMPSQDKQLTIYERELNTLLDNTMKLSKLNEQQKLRLKTLAEDSESQKQQLIILTDNLSSSQKRIDDLLKELQTLKKQLTESQTDLENLRLQLVKAEDSYKSLYESFLQYQKETSKQIARLKQEAFLWGAGAFTGWVTAVVFVISWLIERYVR